jgi:rRNA-processing protein FCF1
LHNISSDHEGIIICTEDKNLARLAKRIDEAISVAETLAGKLIRVNRPVE